ncbi:MAG: tetratricopeptide repeat protein [Nevskia sp.]|nr:tetratricopeptide repeat protein [Nevskia sp.]
MRRGATQLAVFLLTLAGTAAAAPTADVYSPGGENDPGVREAEFLAGNGRYLDAAALLSQMRTSAPSQRLGTAYHRELADDTLAFGIPARAELIYREQIASATDPVSLAQARLHLADFYYQRGYYQQATDELNAMHAQLPKKLVVNWQDLQSRVLLAQGRYGEAADVLTQGDNGSDQSQLMRYNLGVALINDGRVGQGVNVLDRVGRMTPTDSETLALRDKANLTLAYHFLRSQQGGTAVPIFERIRTDGPYSNKALLGLGWAHLAPRGTQQKKAELGDEAPKEPTAFTSFATIGVLLRPGYIDSDSIYKRAQLTPFHLTGKSAGEEAQLKLALVPWVELTNRDPMDPAVQECMLAIPYVLDRLGAHIQAKEYYERAIPALEQTRTRLDEAMEHVRSGRMVTTMIKRDAEAETGWTWKLKDLPDAPETFYLQTLIAENRFQEALKNFRDVRMLQLNLQNWKSRLADLQQSYATRTTEEVTAPAKPEAQPSTSEPSDAPPDEAGSAAAMQLRMAERLGAATEPAGTKASGAGEAVQLQLAPSPGAEQFVGAYERMDALRAKIDALLPQLATAEKAQGKLLQDVATDDLQRQKVLNEKYLIESRFALARVYDSQLKDEPK